MFDSRVPDDLEDTPAGVALAGVLASLEWDRLSGYDLIRALKAQDRQIAHYQAGRCWSIDQIVAIYEKLDEGKNTPRLNPFEVVDGAAAEIGAALGLTRRTAENQTGFAVELCRHQPRVFEALLFGSIDLYRAQILTDTLCLVDEPSVVDDLLDEILSKAGQLTSGQLRHRLQSLVIDVAPSVAKQRYNDAVEDRRVELRANDPGTADLSVRDVNPKDATEIRESIHHDALALKRRGDKRTLDQLRADICVDRLKTDHHTGTCGHTTGNTTGGVHLSVTLEMLAGLSQISGDIEGYGPVIDDIARQIAANQTNTQWTWTLRDPDTGLPIDGGTTRRRPTAAQKRYVQAHNPTCVHPGCRMPAANCDIDHRIPWNHRRVTCTADLAPLCKHHHVIRHTWGWTYQSLPNGDWIYTTPLHHKHTTTGKPP